MLAMLFVVLNIAAFFGKVLSDTMRVIMTHLMGIILLSIAVEMIMVGTKAVLPGLA